MIRSWVLLVFRAAQRSAGGILRSGLGDSLTGIKGGGGVDILSQGECSRPGAACLPTTMMVQGSWISIVHAGAGGCIEPLDRGVNAGTEFPMCPAISCDGPHCLFAFADDHRRWLRVQRFRRASVSGMGVSAMTGGGAPFALRPRLCSRDGALLFSDVVPGPDSLNWSATGIEP